ncbi:integrase [Thauera sinica]|nr:integrase [Thauera sp. K11]
MRRRSRRSDAGQLTLTHAEAQMISAYLMSAFSRHGKQRASVTQTLAELRANRILRAERVIPATGEVVTLSDAAVTRALRHYGLHPEQLNRQTPYVHLTSPHANWCWQMDASVCVIYYLPREGAMIREMTEAEFYAGKPQNWNRIAGQMVIRYLMTEHRWGMMRLGYVQGAESGEHACDHLIRSMLRPDDARGMLWGTPNHLMVDPGSAQTGSQFRRLCRRMGINLIINKPGNPRAKGQVEVGHNIVERNFEHGLKLLGREIRGLDDLNRLGGVWQRWFNTTAIHSRHGRTRFAGWAQEVAEYLIAPPSEAAMRDLAIRDPKTPTVAGDLSVAYEGGRYYVGHVPDIRVGETVQVCLNPWRDGEVVLIRDDDRGRELQFPLPEMVRDEAGQYPTHGATIGVDYSAPPDTAIDANRKAVTKLIAGEAALKAAEKKLRRKDTVPLEAFGIDPLKRAREADLPAEVPEAAATRALETAPAMVISLVRAARLIRDGLARELTDAEFEWISRRWTKGVPEQQIGALITQFGSTADASVAPPPPAAERIERVA